MVDRRYFGTYSARVISILALAFSVVVAQAADYDTWTNPDAAAVGGGTSGDVGRLLNELRGLVDDADRAKAADPRFLQDLRDLIQSYDWPWPRAIINEDFTDGRVAGTPKWQVVSGEFRAQVGKGLTSVVTVQQTQQQKQGSSEEELARLLLEQLLKGQSSNETASAQTQPQEAKIHANTDISNAFALKAELERYSQQSKVLLGVYQGNHNGTGYRLVYHSGQNDSIELLRVTSRGTAIIDGRTLGAKRTTRELMWTRDASGNMTVNMDGSTVLQARDYAIKQPFAGISIVNQGGSVAVRKLTLHGASY